MRTLSDGRVRRSREEWREILRRFRRSGLSEVAFCEGEKFSRSSFAAWKRRLSDEAVESPPFIELGPVTEPVETSFSTGEFELSLPGGVVLRWKA